MQPLFISIHQKHNGIRLISITFCTAFGKRVETQRTTHHANQPHGLLSNCFPSRGYDEWAPTTSAVGFGKEATKTREMHARK